MGGGRLGKHGGTILETLGIYERDPMGREKKKKKKFLSHQHWPEMGKRPQGEEVQKEGQKNK